ARRFAGIISRLLPGKLRASALLVANQRTRRALPGATRGRVVPLVENGVDLAMWSPPARDARFEADDGHQPPRPVRFVFTGRLVDWKGVDLLLEAFKSVAAQTPA